MKGTPYFLFIFLAIFFIHCQQTPTNYPHQEEWLPLFNGKDLTGWDIKIAGFEVGVNYLNTVRVEEGIMKLSYEDYDTFAYEYGHIYYEKPYSHYLLRAEYRFVGEQTPGGAPWNVRNSGIMLHAQSAKEQGINQHFPISIETQFLGGLSDGNERPTANLCTPGTMVEYNGKLDRTHCISSSSNTYDGDQWVRVDMLVLGDSVIHHIIGEDTVLTFKKPQIDSVYVSQNNFDYEQAEVPDPTRWRQAHGQLLNSGYIALQAESHSIHFRQVDLLNLKGCMDPNAKNYKSYFVEADPDACVY
ncbi:MAG: DUF1080 domain-containing protein [Bacteroidota bacterium]